MTRTRASGCSNRLGDRALQKVRVLHGLQIVSPSAVGVGDRPVRLDREVGDHRERVRVLDDRDVGLIDRPPFVASLSKHVRMRKRIVGAKVSGAAPAGHPSERRFDREHTRQLGVRDPHRVGGGLGDVS